jgi:D-alanyl-lipoteichoic acid acyltransferase DltB (MBOAT superfamily)
MRLFFTLFAIMIASHFLYDIEETSYATVFRLVYIAVLLLIGILKKVWLSYVVVFLWLISFIVRGDIMVT